MHPTLEIPQQDGMEASRLEPTQHTDHISSKLNELRSAHIRASTSVQPNAQPRECTDPAKRVPTATMSVFISLESALQAVVVARLTPGTAQAQMLLPASPEAGHVHPMGSR
jgi:chemotaxis response regulator CheB